MKGVILAGGLGTRLYPLTYATNKHLLPVYDRPMIFYPIKTLVDAGIKEIMIVVGGPHAGHFVSVLRNGKDLGIKHLEFAYQESIEVNGKKVEGGIPHALALAKDFADNGSLAVILGDNTTDANISSAVKNFKTGANIFLKEVPDPERFGVPAFASKDNKRIIRLEEKPKVPKSRYAVTGLYMFDNQVFEFIRQLKPSKRNEYEITELCNIYLQADMLKFQILKGYWSDAGTFESIFRAGEHWAKQKGKKS